MNPEHGIHRRSLTLLAIGHSCVDTAQGAIPALLPFLIDQRGLSYGAAGALLLIMSIGSSTIQPLFGLGSDRLSLPWLLPLGVILSGVGIAVVGLTESYTATAIAVGISGLGVAAYHPEGARFAHEVSGSRRGSGMSLYALGGNIGFALGPILVTPSVLLFGLHGTLLLLVLPTIVAGVLMRELGALRKVAAHKATQTAQAVGEPDPDDVPAFLRLGGLISLRSAIYFGLQAFVPVWFIHELGTSKGAGNAALTAMVVAGAIGTYTGGRFVDRVGRQRLVLMTSSLMPVLLVAFVLAPDAPAAGVLVALTGFVMIATFSTTVVMSQEYLPSRLGLASGVSLGLAIGVGGASAAGMGVIADAAGLSTVMWLIVGLSIPMLLLAHTLPVTRADRRARGVNVSAGAAAAQAAPVPGSSSPRRSG